MGTRCSRGRILTTVCAWVILLLVGLDCRSLLAQETTGEDTYRYDPAGKRDPFLPPFVTGPEETIPEEAKTPLQRFDLGQLKLVGVIWEAPEPKALIEDSGGLGYIVTQGTPIGSKGGFVKTIEAKRVVVEEYQTDFYGKRQVQESELPLSVTDSARDGETTRGK